ncbi:hypothetical protein HU200_001953 [Digitaria exilis]|uniref:Uncharacterized protein n=1 Tax=Digitaria exilis TaxID=1010633 RepID=A0A835FY43_9POAL|nr:hypothetical protein HU200_001953 [Digitaria exilis]
MWAYVHLLKVRKRVAPRAPTLIHLPTAAATACGALLAARRAALLRAEGPPAPRVAALLSTPAGLVLHAWRRCSARLAAPSSARAASRHAPLCRRRAPACAPPRAIASS